MFNEPGPTTAHDPADHGAHGHHVLPLKVLLGTFAALVALTVLTVGLALLERDGAIHFGGGAGSVVVALTIAGVKATLVGMFFMALKYDNKVNALAFLLGVVFLVVFFAFTFLDTGFRGEFDGIPDSRNVDEIELTRQALEAENEALQPLLEREPVVLPGDTALVGPAPPAPVQ